MTRTFCGIDPGREKFGFAVCTQDALLFSAILPVNETRPLIACIAARNYLPLAHWRQEGEIPAATGKPAAVFIGNGTGADFFIRKLQKAAIDHQVVDEKMTTLEGRQLYWRLHPPTGLWRFFPLSLRVPPRPLDDLAAWAIAQRGVAEISR